MKIAKASVNEMVSMYLSGMEPEEIRSALGYKTTDYVIQKLRAAKVYDRHRRIIDAGKIRALHNANWPVSKIAAEEGLSESKVREVLNNGFGSTSQNRMG